MTGFAYPADLIKPLHVAWYEYRRYEYDLPPLPDDERLRKILEICYHASFTVEEGRRTKVSVIVCETDAAEGAFMFELSRPFNVHELMRLAPVAASGLAIGVNHPETNGEPTIWGLCSDAPMQLAIRIFGPGTIDITRNGHSIIELRAGKIIAEGGSGSIFQTISEFLDRANAAAWEDVEFVAAWSPQAVIYPGYLFGVAIDIQKRGHGGTIIVVPSNAGTETPTWRHHLRIKYPCAGVSIWQEIRSSILAYDQGAAERARLIRSSIEEAAKPAEHLLSRVADLASVDGAVVISDRFDVYGFGAEVTVGAAVDSVTREDGVSVPIEHYGTRHRAAFRFVSANPDCIAIVCSQDGGTRCVRSIDGYIRIYE